MTRRSETTSHERRRGPGGKEPARRRTAPRPPSGDPEPFRRLAARAAELQAEDALRLESSTATELLATLDSSEVFRVLGERVHSIAGGAAVALAEFDPRARTTTVRDLRCTPEERRSVVEVLGRDPVGATFTFPDEARRRWTVGELMVVPGGLPELILDQVPHPICDRLTRELRLDQVLGMACAHEDDVLGSIAVFTHQGRPLRNRKLIEALVVLAGLALKRLRAEEARKDSEERFRLILETTSDGVWTVSLDGVIREVNDAGCAMTGYGRAELIGMHVSQIDTLDDPQEVARRARLLASGAQRHFESRHRRKDGSLLDVEVTALYLDQEGGRIACFVRDITERRRAEQALRDADARKNEFLAVLSHELRNPLAPLRNGLHLLDRAVPGSDQALRARAVIGRQVDQLARLVDDLLDVTRITRGKIQIRKVPLELRSLLAKVTDDHGSLLAAAGVELDVSTAGGPLWTRADAARIAQVVGNLLHNAAKFTPRGGRVAVSLDREHGQTARIRVRDTGIGIDGAALGRLFEPFVQEDSSIERNRGGLGLGLALVKGLVDLHGGTVEAHSDGPGRGAEFTVRLPLDPDAAVDATAAAPVAVRAGSTRRVLIVEDNLDAAESLREVLELAGHSVVVAHDGPDGVDRARVFAPEVVLCDIGLPGMDGYAVARAIQGLSHDAGRPGHRSVAGQGPALLVALTGYARPEDFARSREAGFAAHLVKPPDLGALVQLISRAPSIPAAEPSRYPWT